MKEIAAVDCWRLFSPRFPFKMIDLTSLTCPVLGLLFFYSLPKRCFKQTPNRQRDIKEPQFRCDNNKIIFHFIYFHIKAFICGGLQQLFSLTFWKLKTKNPRTFVFFALYFTACLQALFSLWFCRRAQNESAHCLNERTFICPLYVSLIFAKDKRTVIIMIELQHLISMKISHIENITIYSHMSVSSEGVSSLCVERYKSSLN